MELGSLEKRLNEELDSALISSRVLLSRFRLIDENSRRAGAYQDPRYAPFFYHLGKHIQPKRVVEIGVRLGLLSGSFFQSCKSAQEYVGFQQKGEEFYSPRLAKANLKDVFKGDVFIYVGDLDEAWVKNLHPIPTVSANDLAIVNDSVGHDDLRNHLDHIWNSMKLDGLIVVDGIGEKSTKDAFTAFCKLKNRTPIIFKTRYGTGIVKK